MASAVLNGSSIMNLFLSKPAPKMNIYAYIRVCVCVSIESIWFSGLRISDPTLVESLDYHFSFPFGSFLHHLRTKQVCLFTLTMENSYLFLEDLD